jgi:ubiquinone/menaquinone biosynthesis C-methylase UbiE
VDPETVELLARELVGLLGLRRDDRLLDLCCGNGVLTFRLAEHTSSALGLDLSPALVENARARRRENLQFAVGDVRDLEVADGSFDRILLYAALQYFDEAETVSLLGRSRRWLASGGTLLLGDVPDLRRRWAFFDTADRRAAYFHGLAAGEPVIGTWFDPDWVRHAGSFAGFESVEILAQHPRLPYAHFRFDARLRA